MPGTTRGSLPKHFAPVQTIQVYGSSRLKSWESLHKKTKASYLRCLYSARRDAEVNAENGRKGRILARVGLLALHLKTSRGRGGVGGGRFLAACCWLPPAF